jgi:molybdate transport system substrate-binding protein
MRLVLQDKVDLGVTQVSEVVQANPDALLGTFPAQFDLATTFSLWYPSNSSAAAKDFVTLVTGPGGRAKLTKDGLRPLVQR